MRRSLTTATLLGAAALAALSGELHLRAEPVYAPVIEASYVLTTVSGGTTITETVNQGATHARDVNGDGTKDLSVRTTIDGSASSFFESFNGSTIVAPNISIDRHQDAVVAAKPAPPVRVLLTFTIRDVSAVDPEPPTKVSFGYEVKAGGAIPTRFNAAIGGLQNAFNPVEAVVSTGRTLLQPGATYEGPVTILAGYDSPAYKQRKRSVGEFELSYRPLPANVRIKYARDLLTNALRFDYEHSELHEVDLESKVTTVTGNDAVRARNEVVEILGRVNRLPSEFSVDYFSALEENVRKHGTVEYRMPVDAAYPNRGKPDVAVDFRTSKPHPDGDGLPPVELRAIGHVESVPNRIKATWTVPEKNCAPTQAAPDRCLTNAVFEVLPLDPQNPPATLPKIGAVEAYVTTFLGAQPVPYEVPAASEITPWVPTRKQFANLQVAGLPSGELKGFLAARVEGINRLEYGQTHTGFVAKAKVGDGEQPLAVHVESTGNVTPLMKGTAEVAPVPDDIRLELVRPSTDGTRPMTVKYDASKTIRSLTGAFEYREEGALVTDPCGSPFTACGTVKAEHLPKHARVTYLDTPARLDVAVDAGNVADSQGNVLVDTDPNAYRPKLVATGALRLKAENPPIVAELEVLDLPTFLRARFDKGDRTVLRANTCKVDYSATAPACATGTEQPLGKVRFAARNFVVRPAGMPEPIATTPLYATYSARPATASLDKLPVAGKDLFEATGQMTQVRSVEFSTDKATGLTGLRTRLGDATQAFSAQVDVRGVELSAGKPVDLVGSTTINPLPSELSFCMRSADKPMPPGQPDPGSTTVDCEGRAPFPNIPPLTTTPTSIGYRGNAVFDVLADFRLTDLRTPGVADDNTIRAALDVENVPQRITAHVQTPPKDTTGPIRAHFATPDATEDVKLAFSASVTDADLACRWPKPVTVANQAALCMKAAVPDLPTSATFSYDPAGVADNVLIENAGTTKKMDVTGLELSSVKGVLDTKTNKVGTSVLVAEGSITGLPRKILGTLLLPGTIDFRADPATDAVEAVHVEVRNFLAPDPTPKDVPAQRAGLPAPSQKFYVFQRGPLVRAEADITDLVGAGYLSVRDSDGRPLDTSVIRVDFGKNQVIRTYADIEYVPDATKPDVVSHLIGDVTLVDVPAGIDLCFRGPKTAPTAPAAPTFCDTAPQAEEGAFQVSGRAVTGTVPNIDVHAFVRAASAGGADVMAGRLDIDNIPRTVQGTFSPAGRVTFAGFDAAGNPDGIDKIALELADADLQDHGYAETPWGDSRAGLEPFPAPPGNQFLQVAATDANYHVRGSIGSVPSGGSTPNGSAPKRIYLANDACPTSGAPDYPYLPSDSVSKYTCFRAEFEQLGSGTADPLLLDVDVDRGGKRIGVRDGRVENIPASFQINLAETDKLDGNGALRVPCGTTAPPSGQSCMPPFVRIDTSEEFVVGGQFELGDSRDIGDMAKTAIRGRMASLSAKPTAAGWSDWGPDPLGIRAGVGVFEGLAGPRAAVVASARFKVPRSITLDQIQSWSDEQPVAGFEKASAKDIRLRFVARDGNGVVTQDLGQLAAVVNFYGDGSQIIVDNSTGNDGKGFEIPGELGTTIFLRESVGAFPGGEEGEKLKRTFIQADGRLHEKLTLRARVFDGRKGDSFGVIDARIKDLQAADANTPAGQPSFRARAEIALKLAKEDTRGLPEKIITCVFYCLGTQVKPAELVAELDFEPGGGLPPARRIDAYVNALVPEVAAEVRGFSGVDGNDKTPVTAKVSVLLDPMNIELHAYIPIVGNFDMVLLSKLNAEVQIDKANEFRVWNNMLHLRAEHDGPGTDSYIYAGWQPRFVLGLATSALALALTGNPVVYGFTWAWPPELPPPAILTYYPCPGTEGGAGIERLRLGADGADQLDVKDVYAFPNNPPTGPEVRWVTFGTLGVFDLLGKIVGPAFCEIGSFSATLMDADHPGPPFGVVHHEIPGFGSGGTPNPPAQPKPQPTTLTVEGTQAFCGDHTFKTVTVPPTGRLVVANAAGPFCRDADRGRLALTAETIDVHGTVDTNGAAGVTSLTAKNISVSQNGRIWGSTGPVRLVASDRLQVDGIVAADGVSAQTASGGAAANSGAGHGARGGKGSADGSDPAGGAPYGNHDPNTAFDAVDGVIPSEAGARGAGSAPGNGGGVLSLSANVVRIAGEVRANGAPGGSDDLGACSVADNPNTTPNEALPNTGRTGSGGGSGGGVVVAGTVVDVTGGKLEAAGGNGGSGKRGGGGGGAGGVLKLVAPVYRGTAPNRAGGAGGASGCPGDFPHGAAGGTGVNLTRRAPASQVGSLGAAYVKGSPLSVPYGAAAATVGTNDDYRVVLCGLQRPPQASRPKAGESKAERNYGIDMPTGPAVTNPCGTLPGGSDTTLHELGRAEHLAREEAPADAAFDVGSQLGGPEDNGFWGFYTVVLKGGRRGAAANDCLDRTDYFLPDTGNPADAVARAAAYDAADCSVEPLADAPDFTVGVDNAIPSGTITGPAETRGDRIKITVSNVADRMSSTDGSGALEEQSGVASVRCSNSSAPESFVDCPEGDSEWFLTPGSGGKRVYLKVVDVAGNERLTYHNVTSDVTSPRGRLIVEPDTADGDNGWYSTSPAFALTDFCDGQYNNSGCLEHAGASGAAVEMFEYWFDGGSRRQCRTSPCEIRTQLPGTGRHRLYWQAVDMAGNRSQVFEHFFKVDGKKPSTALLTGPGAPDGANGWYVTDPVVVINGADQVAGSGLVAKATETQAAGIYYKVGGGTAKKYAGAFTLGNGEHRVCHWAKDVAGNVGDEVCDTLKVDVTDPTAAHTVAAPGGANGWYLGGPVSYAPNPSDQGSGVKPSYDDFADLCGPLPARTTATDGKTPSGMCVSVDGGPYQPYTSTRTLTDGRRHVVRSFAVDVAGRRSPLRTDVFGIDTAAPVSTLRMLPALPSAGGVYRGTATVALRALDNDGHAGVTRISYRIGSGPERDYLAPFVVPNGTHTITWRAYDAAGRVEADRSQVVVVDGGVTSVAAGVPHPTGTTPPASGIASWNRVTHPTATLPFDFDDDRAGPFQVTVLVYGELLPSEGMSLLRRITTTVGADGAGHVLWDGQYLTRVNAVETLQPVPKRNSNPLTGPVTDGRYHYRVVVEDAAGNVVQSTDSRQIEVTV